MSQTPSLKVMIVDDEADMRASIAQWMELSGFVPVLRENAAEALSGIDSDFPGIVISDVRMPGIDGLELLSRLQARDQGLPVIMITGHGDVAMAVEAMRMGAYDFVEKPFDPNRLTDLASRALTARRLTLDNRLLRRELSDGSLLLRRLVGDSPPMLRLREEILDFAQADTHVVVWGETGAGKSLVARALHACGPRQGKPFIKLNCAAHEPEELAALFFGQPGALEVPVIHQVGGGTLCLTEVASMPTTLQARLVELLQSRDAASDRSASPRIVTLTEEPLADAQSDGRLRADLFFRLSAMELTVPPLRERGEDVLLLFERFARQFAEEYGCEPPELSASDAAFLLQSHWPGNVRQLQNLAERAVLQARRSDGAMANLALVAEPQDTVTAGAPRPLRDHVDAFEKMLIQSALRRHRGTMSAVMEELALPRRTLNEKMAKYGLSRSDYL
ncbi:MAG: sigma-54 dependent transcriptional regulator [Pseudomonadota bacterium]